MNRNLKFIIIENDAILLKTLLNLVEKIFVDTPIHRASNAEKGLEIIEKYGEDSIIISEPNLAGKSGIEILNDVKKNMGIKNNFFFIIVSPNDKSTKVSALKAGVDGYINKPFAVEEIIPTLRGALNSLKQKNEINAIESKYKTLKEDFDREIDKIKAIIDMFVYKRIPGLHKYIEQMIKAASFIAEKNIELDYEKTTSVVNALKMFYSGRLFLEDKYVGMPIMEEGRLRSAEMKDIVKDASSICDMIKGYESASTIIQFIYENHDGTGFPKGLKKGEIPKEARLLRVIIDYYELLSKDGKQNEIIDKMVMEANRLYEMNYVAYLDQYLAVNDPESEKDEKTITVKLLRTELVLSRNIFLTNSLVLLAKDTVLNEENVAKIREVAKNGEIIGQIYVYDVEMPSEEEIKKKEEENKKKKEEETTGGNENEEKSVEAGTEQSDGKNEKKDNDDEIEPNEKLEEESKEIENKESEEAE